MPREAVAMARQRNSPMPFIPAEIRDAAAAELVAEEARGRAFREQVEKDQCCVDAVKAFRDGTDALWSAPPDQARSLLAPVHKALLGACKALEEVGRLDPFSAPLVRMQV